MEPVRAATSGSDTPTPRIAEESHFCIEALPATARLASTRDAGWMSLLVERSRSAGPCPEYETLPTRDHTFVVVAAGDVEVSARANGAWRRNRYSSGTVGRTAAGRSDRLAWRTPRVCDAFEKIHLFLPDGFLQEAAEELRRTGGPSSAQPDFSLAFADPLVSQTAASLLAAAAAGAPDLYAETAARMLAVHVLTKHGRFGVEDGAHLVGPVSDRRIARTVDYMRAHLDEAIPLSRLAAEAGISKFHFARVFRESTGSTPTRLLTRMRMETARRLLLEGESRIGLVAERCGYPNPAHFSTAYRRQFGLSPREQTRGPKRSGG